jgi:hypothetical protein
MQIGELFTKKYNLHAEGKLSKKRTGPNEFSGIILGRFLVVSTSRHVLSNCCWNNVAPTIRISITTFRGAF